MSGEELASIDGSDLEIIAGHLCDLEGIKPLEDGSGALGTFARNLREKLKLIGSSERTKPPQPMFVTPSNLEVIRKSEVDGLKLENSIQMLGRIQSVTTPPETLAPEPTPNGTSVTEAGPVVTRSRNALSGSGQSVSISSDLIDVFRDMAERINGIGNVANIYQSGIGVNAEQQASSLRVAVRVLYVTLIFGLATVVLTWFYGYQASRSGVIAGAAAESQSKESLRILENILSEEKAHNEALTDEINGLRKLIIETQPRAETLVKEGSSSNKHGAKR